jgi:hypothetical protein
LSKISGLCGLAAVLAERLCLSGRIVERLRLRQGHSPKFKEAFTEGESRILTTGGEAETEKKSNSGGPLLQSKRRCRLTINTIVSHFDHRSSPGVAPRSALTCVYLRLKRIERSGPLMQFVFN